MTDELHICPDDEDMGDFQTPVYVCLPCCGDRVDELTVEFLDIEEDIQGRDLLTFRCPRCGQPHTSYRLG